MQFRIHSLLAVGYIITHLDPSSFKELTVYGKNGASGLTVQPLVAMDPKLELERVLSQLLEATTPVWGTLRRLQIASDLSVQVTHGIQSTLTLVSYHS